MRQEGQNNRARQGPVGLCKDFLHDLVSLKPKLGCPTNTKITFSLLKVTQIVIFVGPNLGLNFASLRRCLCVSDHQVLDQGT